MMTVANAMAATLGGVLTITGADDPAAAPSLQQLLDRGFEVIAEGRLVGAVDCAPEMASITTEEIRRGYKGTCFLGKVTYGAFKRLKGDNSEFVCVSFKDWVCYQSQDSNSR
jgi:hypothetical protein